MKKFFAILLTVCMLLPLFAMLPIGAAAPPTEGYQFSKRDYVDGVRQGTDDNESWYFADKKLSDVPYTIEAWFRVDEDHPKTVNAGTIVGNHNGWDNYAWWRFDIITYEDKLIPYFSWNEQYNNAKSTRTFNFYTTEVIPGEWMHFAVVIDAQNSKVYGYVNGELNRTVDVDIHLTTLSENLLKLPVMVGNDGRCGPLPSNNVFDGKISSVSLFKDVRTAAEIKSDYDNGAPYTDENAIAHWEFSPAGGAVTDKTGNGYSLSESKYWLTEDEMIELRKQNGMLQDDGTANYIYSFAAVGDIQYMTEADIKNGYTYENYTEAYITKIHQWIADNTEGKKIQYVMNMGDITQSDTDAQWHLAYSAISSTLNGVVDYSVIRGNHDLYSGDDGTMGLDLVNGGIGFNTYWANDTTYMAQFDGIKGGLYEAGSVANVWYTKTIEGVDWLFLNLDFGPTDDVVAWANGVLYDHPDHQVIITTHCYLHMDGTTCDDEDTGSTDEAVQNNGDELWDKLVSRHSNIKMVLSGHQESNNIMFRQSKGADDTTVSQFLIDQQDVDIKYMNAGEAPLGLVAMLYFGENGKVWVEWYSTLHGKYYQTRNQFSFDLNAECEEQDTSWSGLSITPLGSGAENDPYIIQSAGNLMWMSEQVKAKGQISLSTAGNTAAFEGAYFKQVCDIDLGGLLIQSIGYYHTSVSNTVKVAAFAGTYDGGGYKIKNGSFIPYNYSSDLATKNSHGFNINWADGVFGCIYGATIKNVTLDELNVYSNGVTGGLVGRALAPNDGSAASDFNVISNCHITSSCTINAWFAKGVTVDTTTETRFEYYDTRYNAGVVGSICGMAYATTIQGCSSDVDLKVDGYHDIVGGIAGTAAYNTVVEYCKFTGSITLTDNKTITDATTGNLVPFTMGGIVGLISPTKITDTMWDYDDFDGGLEILNCYNEGTFAYTGSGALVQELHVGGILGHARYLCDQNYENHTYLIKGCYNLAELTAPATTDGTWLGGIVGKTIGTAYGYESTLWIEDSASVAVSASGGVGTNEYRATTDRPTAHGTALVAPVTKDSVSTVTTKAAAEMTDAIAAIELGMTMVQNGGDTVSGNKWFTGTGEPIDEANNGDMYLDSETGDVYQYNNGWIFVMNIKGEQGQTGATGAAGNKWYTGNGAPTDSLTGMIAGDLYLDLSSGDVYEYTVAWGKIGNIKGADGENGENGQNGQNGADGNTWTVGEGVPTGEANNGDMYYDKTSCVVYQYNGSAWTEIGSIKGADGADANRWYFGEGAPTDPDFSVTGAISGDMYMNTEDGMIYSYDGSTWTELGCLKGEKGDTGETGATATINGVITIGTNGNWFVGETDTGVKAQGPQGETGSAGTAGNTWTVGEGEPSGTANVGDMYYDNETCKVYQYQSTGWTEIGSIKGDKGDQGDQGIQGPIGETGQAGEDGNKWYTGNGAPADSLTGMIANDLYLDLDSGDVYEYTTAWGKIGNIKGATGQDGQDGQNGQNGTDGADGNTWTVGEGEPSGTANVGDMYYDKTSCVVYQYNGSAWTEIGSIKGDKGDQGDQGIQGPTGETGQAGENGEDGEDGNKWYTGAAAPTASSAYNAGDMYMNTQTGDVYRYNGTAWVSAGNLTGPQGETGATGATGAQGEKGEKGDTGAQGEKGEDGADASVSDSANAAGGTGTNDASVSSEKSGNGLAIAAIVVAVVIGGANAAFVVVLLLKKKKTA